MNNKRSHHKRVFKTTSSTLFIESLPKQQQHPPSLTKLRTTTCIYNSQCVFSWLPFNIPWVCEIGIYGPRWWVQNGSRLRFSPPTKDPTCNPTHGCTNTRTYIRKQVWIAQRPRNRVTRCSRLHTNRVNEIKVKTVLTLAGGLSALHAEGKLNGFWVWEGGFAAWVLKITWPKTILTVWELSKLHANARISTVEFKRHFCCMGPTGSDPQNVGIWPHRGNAGGAQRESTYGTLRVRSCGAHSEMRNEIVPRAQMLFWKQSLMWSALFGMVLCVHSDELWPQVTPVTFPLCIITFGMVLNLEERALAGVDELSISTRGYQMTGATVCLLGLGLGSVCVMNRKIDRKYQ